MNKILRLILSFPKTIYFNLCAFHLKEALKLQVLISYDTKIGKIYKGCIQFDGCTQLFQLRFGFGGSEGIISKGKSYISIEKNARLYIKGKVCFSEGNSVRIDEDAILIIGQDFFINKNGFIACSRKISIGDDVLVGWNVSIRDSDGHTILYKGEPKNSLKEVIIGNHIWIASYVDILKGSRISDDSVIAYRSFVLGEFKERNLLIGGSPAKVLQTEIDWRH